MQRILAFLCNGANKEGSKSDGSTNHDTKTEEIMIKSSATTAIATSLPNSTTIDDACDAGGTSRRQFWPDPPGDSSTTHTASTNNNSCATIRPPRCQICFDDANEIATATSNNDLIFVHCFDQQMDIHWFCKHCIREYLSQCENDRKQGPVVCPYDRCSVNLSDNVVKEILQRPYQPKVWYQNNAATTIEDNSNAVADENKKKKDNEDDDDNYDHDAEFYHWISQQDHMQCDNCHVYIVREEGCDAMQCLCGWRFCYECKLPIPEDEEDIDDDDCCICRHDYGDFYDNILKTEGVEAPDVATHDELQDMANFYNRRRKELDDGE